jgi:hypothetical protein
MTSAAMTFTQDRIIVEQHIELNSPSSFREAYGKLLESQKMRFEDYTIVLNRGGRNDLIQNLFDSVLKEEQDRCANFAVLATPIPPPPEISEHHRLSWSLTNDVRIRQCLQPLNWNSQLAVAAQKWAEELEVLGTAVHCAEAVANEYASCGAAIQKRVQAAGYQGAAGENVASGPKTADPVVQLWWDSRAHRRNLLKPTYTEYGAGVVFRQPGKPFTVMWVQNFGIPPESAARALDGANGAEFVPKSEQQPTSNSILVGVTVGVVAVVVVAVVVVVLVRRNQQKQIEQV